MLKHSKKPTLLGEVKNSSCGSQLAQADLVHVDVEEIVDRPLSQQLLPCVTGLLLINSTTTPVTSSCMVSTYGDMECHTSMCQHCVPPLGFCGGQQKSGGGQSLGMVTLDILPLVYLLCFIIYYVDIANEFLHQRSINTLISPRSMCDFGPRIDPIQIADDYILATSLI